MRFSILLSILLFIATTLSYVSTLPVYDSKGWDIQYNNIPSVSSTQTNSGSTTTTTTPTQQRNLAYYAGRTVGALNNAGQTLKQGATNLYEKGINTGTNLKQTLTEADISLRNGLTQRKTNLDAKIEKDKAQLKQYAKDGLQYAKDGAAVAGKVGQEVAGRIKDGVVDTGNAVVKGVKTAGTIAVGGAVLVGEKVVDGAVYTGKAIKNGVVTVGEKTVDGVKYTGQLAKDGAHKVHQGAKNLIGNSDDFNTGYQKSQTQKSSGGLYDFSSSK